MLPVNGVRSEVIWTGSSVSSGYKISGLRSSCLILWLAHLLDLSGPAQ